MHVASAPVSWGITEVAGLRADLPYTRVMDEIRAAGYAGTELGPWGFYPTGAERLAAELAARELALVGAFVDVPIHDPTRFDVGRQAVRQVVPLLAALGAPVLVLAAQQTPERARIAGGVREADGLDAVQWQAAGAYLMELAAAARDQGLAAVFHHHAGTWVETPREIARLFQAVDSDVLGLCLDTGHLVYGGGDPLDCLATYGPVIRHVHLKNVDAGVLEQVPRRRLDYLAAVRAGIFCPLDAGVVDIAAVTAVLQRRGYGGWLVVEQDVDVTAPGHPDPLSGARRDRAYLRSAAEI